MSGPEEREMEEAREMAEFAARLRHELRRVDAPRGFADAVMRLAETEERPPVRARSKAAQIWGYGALAAMLALCVAGGERVHRERQREKADAEFEMAMRVTDRTLDHVQEQLQRAGVSLDMTNKTEER